MNKEFICHRCNIEMKIGKVIYPYELKNTFYDPSGPVANKDNLKIVDCWKCPNCGNSEELK